MLIAGEKGKNLAMLSRHQTFWTLVVFVCLSVYTLGANPFAGETVAPFDQLLEHPGWASVHGNRKAVHFQQSDIVDAQLPAWITLKDQIRKGESPLWYPNGAGGQPVSFEFCNPTFLLFLSIKDNALAYYFVGLAKLIISGLGVYLLLRIFLPWLPSIWGGIVFMLCGFNATWFFWEHVATAMWIPWLLWATVMYLKTEGMKWLPAIAAVSLLLIFGGFPAIAGFGFYAFALLVLVWNVLNFFGLIGDRPKHADRPAHFVKKTAFPLLAVGIAFVMSAVVLIPFIDSMSGINLGYRAGLKNTFSVHDLRLFIAYDNPPGLDRTIYVGMPACILALLGIFAIFKTEDKNLKVFILFNVLLALISLLIAFGALPHRFVGALPVFNSYRWGRLVIVTLLSLAALSAVGLDFIGITLQTLSGRYLRLTPMKAQRIIVVVMIGIIAVQFHMQKKLFNTFNAVVPSAWFYPSTPSIAYVKEHLKPLQSVIADSSYWYTGTLGAYGIPEWYAHSFRSDKEKEVLNNLVYDPAPLPTSMILDGANIQFNSPLMDELAIKYVLVNKNFTEHKVRISLPELSHTPAPPLPDNAWRQRINLPNDMAVVDFGFLFATFGKEHAPANIRLTLYNDGGEALSMVLDKNDISDNMWVFFDLPHKIFLKKGAYSLVLSLVDYAGTDKLTVWATKTQENTGNFLEVNGVKTDVSLKLRISYYEKVVPAIDAGKWKVIDLEKDILIFENTQVTNSAYFIKRLDASSNAQVDFSGLDVKQPSPDLIHVTYSGGDAGWIVLPMHLHPGWKASIDDRQVRYDTYLGILPAIPVNGASQVIFKYQPESFRWGVIVSLIGFFLFTLFARICLKKVKQT
jgi:hypothetical protein